MIRHQAVRVNQPLTGAAQMQEGYKHDFGQLGVCERGAVLTRAQRHAVTYTNLRVGFLLQSVRSPTSGCPRIPFAQKFDELLFVSDGHG